MTTMTTFLLLRETRANETRVALTPKDISLLLQNHVDIAFCVEQGAGVKAGFDDAQYEQIGANIRKTVSDTDDNNVKSFQRLFAGVDVIIRAKRANARREAAEIAAMRPGMILIGSLDVRERACDAEGAVQEAPHVVALRQAGVVFHSIDLLDLPRNDPGNLLSVMSQLTGPLAVQESVCRFKAMHHNAPQSLALIGFGVASEAAFHSVLTEENDEFAKINIVSTASGADRARKSIKTHENNHKCSIQVFSYEADDGLPTMQQIVRDAVCDVDIVVTSARRNNASAPLLIDDDTLKLMKRGCVVCDLAGLLLINGDVAILTIF